MRSNSQPKVSVIVPVFNAEDTLGDCLQSLTQVDYPVFEIIVVDDGSTDRSLAIADSFDCTVIGPGANRGAAAARNRGAAQAKGEILAFTDADCIVPRHWLKSLLGSLGEAAAVTGVYAPPQGGSSLSRFVAYDILLRFQRLDARSNVFGTYNAAVLRQAFEEAGGFDEGIGGASWEDVEFGLRLARRGWQLAIDAATEVRHRNSDSLSRYLSKQARKACGQFLARRSRQRSDYVDWRTSAQVVLTPLLLPAAVVALWSLPAAALVLGALAAALGLSNGQLLRVLWKREGAAKAVEGCAWLVLRNGAWLTGILRGIAQMFRLRPAPPGAAWREAWKE